MIKFREKNNNVNKLIDLIYKILNIEPYLDLNKMLSEYIKIDPY